MLVSKAPLFVNNSSCCFLKPPMRTNGSLQAMRIAWDASRHTMIMFGIYFSCKSLSTFNTTPSTTTEIHLVLVAPRRFKSIFSPNGRSTKGAHQRKHVFDELRSTLIGDILQALASVHSAHNNGTARMTQLHGMLFAEIGGIHDTPCGSAMGVSEWCHIAPVAQKKVSISLLKRKTWI